MHTLIERHEDETGKLKRTVEDLDDNNLRAAINNILMCVAIHGNEKTAQALKRQLDNHITCQREGKR